MTEQHPGYPMAPKPPKSKKGIVIALIVIGIALLFICCGVVTSGISKSSDKAASNASKIIAPVEDGPSSDDATGKPAASSGLAKGDVKLSVKTKSKQCFGSAGCNVTYEVKADWPTGSLADGDTCDVTYIVSGLDDASTNTLTIMSATEYQHEVDEFGQTPRSSSKLKVKVSEVECS